MDLLFQPHDRYFKYSFSDPQIAREYLTTFLPPAIFQKMDWDSMVLDTTNYVDDSLSEYFSDLVWILPYRKTKAKVALLLEHKTTPARFIHVQLLSYMVSIWRQDIKEKRKYLTPILPIILYMKFGLMVYRKVP